MILATTYSAAVLLGLLSMFLWGTWASAFKATRNWRFELFYFDFAAGALIAAAIAAFTLGSMGDELSFTDNLLIAGKRQIAFGVAAGVVFNLGNLLLLAAVSVSGMIVAFPIGLGLAFAIGILWAFIFPALGNVYYLIGGAVLAILAAAVCALAYRVQGGAKGFSAKGVILSVASGMLMGFSYPVLEMSRAGEIGLGPYAVAFMFAVGVFASTFVFNLYFMNLPVHGPAVSMVDYFRPKTMRNHALGLVGGALWCAGVIANFVAGATLEAAVPPRLIYALGHAAAFVALLWGVVVWGEFRPANSRAKGMLAIAVLLLAAGLALAALAPVKT